MTVNLRTVGSYTLLVVGALTILSGIGTFFGTLDPLLEEWGMEELTIAFGITKLVIGALMLWNTTRLFGTLVAVSYYGGAVATHVAFDSLNVQFAVVVIVSIALWIGVLTKVQGDKQMI